MFRARVAATLVAAVSLVVGLAVVGVAPAGADGVTNVAMSCDAPIVGQTATDVDVTATDSADPVAPNAAVTNTIKVPVPDLGELPVSVTLKEVKLTTPIPAGVTVTGVTFTSSSLATKTWSVTGSNLVITLSGSYTLSPGGPPPTVPDVMVATTVGATPRTISWKVPSSIVAKIDFFGTQTATCTPVDPNQVLITTTVQSANRAPVAADQAISTNVGTAKAVTLAATDPDGNPLTYSVTTPPAHGTVTGTPPNVTYTPAGGYAGPDSFVFTASDGSLSDTGTVSITVVQPNRAPVAADQSITTDTGVAKAVTLSATDPDGNPLTYSVTTPPAHGTVTGTAPNVTYTPAGGYVGPDSFVFTASDGSLSDTGTVSITVAPAAPTVPAAPTGVTAKAHAGTVAVGWTAPTVTGGSPITGYRIVPSKAGVPQTPVDVGLSSSAVVPAANGSAWTFTVAAVNVVGAGPASAATAAVTPRAWLPFAGSPQAVDRLYSWMLGRTPTTAERTLWVNRLDAGTHGTADLVVALRSDTVSTGVIDPVVRLYEAYFLRTPDKDGITYWVNQRKAGVSLTKISDFFAKSNEFKVLYGPKTNRQFVELIYQNILGRPGEASGVDYWTSQLDTGKRSRGSVMIGFSESAEYKNRQKAKVDAAVLLIFLENRTPSAAERNALAAQIGSTALVEAARGVLRSPAAVARATA